MNMYNIGVKYVSTISGRSRISHWGGGVLTHWGGTNLQRIHFLVKMYAKMKEIDPVGGGGHMPAVPPLDLPMTIEKSTFLLNFLAPTMYIDCMMSQHYNIGSSLVDTITLNCK